MNRTALVLLGLLSLLDVAGIALGDGQYPPFEIAVLGAVLGVISLALLWFTWRAHRGATIALIVVRLVSAATTVPAFVVPGVPGPILAFAAAFVAASVIGCVLLVPGLRRTGAPTP